jgi:hypothetical protein
MLMEILDVQKLKTQLRDRQWAEAVNMLNKNLRVVVEYLMKCEQTNERTIREFNEIIKFIEQAIYNQDVILLCDIIEYELAPFISMYTGERMAQHG